MTERRHVLITGASSGIGTACALHLAREGYGVFAGVRKQEDGERLQKECGANVTPVYVDVTDDASIAAAGETVSGAVGDAGLYGLVNNAGIAVAGVMEAIPLDKLRQQLDVNFFGHVSMIQTFLPLLRQARGRIVNMSSVSGRSVVPLLGPYAASKYALEAVSDALRLELRSSGIAVSLIEPGGVDTPIWDKSESAVKRMLDDWPDATQARYGRLVDALKAATAKSRRQAVSAEHVAKVVGRALSARRPKARYLVGRDAWLMVRLLGPLPDRLRDWLVVRFLGIG